MSDKIIDAAAANEAESWLLPEVSGSHVVGAATKDRQTAGFNSGAKSRPQAQKRSLRALSEKDLKILEAEVRAEAYREGRSEGYETGYREGEQRATERVEEIAQQTLAAQQTTLSSMIDALVDPLAGQTQDYKKLLAELALETAQMLCQRELVIDNSSIFKIVSEAVDAIPLGEKNLRLHLHPADLATLQTVPQLIKPGWQLVGDEQLSQGDCYIETEHSVVDFTRAARVQQIFQDWLDLSDSEILKQPGTGMNAAGSGAGSGTTVGENGKPFDNNSDDSP